MAVAKGTATTASLAAGSGSTCTFSFVSTDQPLYVMVPAWFASQTLSTVTFNGVGLTRVAQSALSNGNDRCELWRLLTPTATTANIVLTFTGTGPAGKVAAFNTTGQDTSTPEGTAATNASSVNGTGTGNLAVSASSGDLHIVCIADGAGAAIAPAATGGTPTEFYDVAQDGEESEGFTVDGAATQVSGTFASTSWAIAAIPLKQTAAPTREQEGYRWRNDDGSESAATWQAAQDTDVTGIAKLTATRLRLLTNATGDPPSEAVKLQWRKVGGTDWQDIR